LDVLEGFSFEIEEDARVMPCKRNPNELIVVFSYSHLELFCRGYDFFNKARACSGRVLVAEKT